MHRLADPSRADMGHGWGTHTVGCMCCHMSGTSRVADRLCSLDFSLVFSLVGPGAQCGTTEQGSDKQALRYAPSPRD